MTDVFISYAREDQALARGLAEDLEALGFTTWWDTELRSGEDFYEVILSALTAAKSAIVIWTANSVKSAFVRDEARYALFHKKLVTTRTPELDMMDVPFGFQSQHTDPVADRDGIVAALEKLGVQPTPPQAAKAASWEELQTSTDIDPLLEFIAQAVDPTERRLAGERIAQLSAAAVAKTGEDRTVSTTTSAEVRSLTTGNLTAFLQGLMLRVPNFQLAKQGKFSAIGVTSAIVFLSIILTLAPGVYAINARLSESGEYIIYYTLVILMFAPLYLAWRYSRTFFASRNKAAGRLLSGTFVVAAFIAGFTTMGTVFVALESTGPSIPRETSVPIAFAVAAIFALIAVYLTYRNVRAAR